MLLANTVFVGFGGGLRRLVVDPTPIGVESSSGDDISFAKPVGTVSGDFLITFGMAIGIGTWTQASGFSEAFQGQNTQLAYKTAGGSEPSTYDLSKSGGGGKAGTVLRIEHGAFDAAGTISSASGSPAAPSITMTRPGLLLAFFRRDSSFSPNITYSLPDGMEPLLEAPVVPDGQDFSFAIFTQQVGSGPTGTRTSIASSGTNHRGVMMGVHPV
jgi:hypothetical protein